MRPGVWRRITGTAVFKKTKTKTNTPHNTYLYYGRTGGEKWLSQLLKPLPLLVKTCARLQHISQFIPSWAVLSGQLLSSLLSGAPFSRLLTPLVATPLICFPALLSTQPVLILRALGQHGVHTTHDNAS